MSYQGPERRKVGRDTENLTKTIAAANANLAVFNADIGYLKSGIDEIKTDIKSHSQEFKTLNGKVDTLPCNGHTALIDANKNSIDKNSKWIQGIVLGFLLCGLLVAILAMFGPKLIAGIMR